MQSKCGTSAPLYAPYTFVSTSTLKLSEVMQMQTQRMEMDPFSAFEFTTPLLDKQLVVAVKLAMHLQNSVHPSLKDPIFPDLPWPPEQDPSFPDSPKQGLSFLGTHYSVFVYRHGFQLFDESEAIPRPSRTGSSLRGGGICAGCG